MWYGYGFDPFQNIAPQEIDKDMLHDMIRVDDMGQIRYNELTQNRWHSSIKDFFYNNQKE